MTQQPITTDATIAMTTPMSTTTAEPTTTEATFATTTPMIEQPTSTAGDTSQPGMVNPQNSIIADTTELQND